MPKDFHHRRSHRHSIVENPLWNQYAEVEQEFSDKNSTTSLRGNKQWLFSPTNSEDRPEIRESPFKSSLKQSSSSQVNAVSLQSAAMLPTSYDSKFDWKQWYNEKVDSDDD